MRCDICGGEMKALGTSAWYCPNFSHPAHVEADRKRKARRTQHIAKLTAKMTPTELEYFNKHYRH